MFLISSMSAAGKVSPTVVCAKMGADIKENRRIENGGIRLFFVMFFGWGGLWLGRRPTIGAWAMVAKFAEYF
jgi:hypothetical protein